MDFPKLIFLDEEVEQRLISYLEVELLNHYGERGSWVEDLIDIEKDYYAEPTSKEKTFPFKGAANIVVPLIAIMVEALHSKTMTSVFALEEIASVKVPGIYEDINWGLTKFINYELLEEGADLYKFANNANLEFLKFGACVGKAGYEKVVKTAIKTIGDKEFEFDITTKQGSIADSVPLANFLLPFYSQDPQTSPWVGEEHNKTAYEVKQMCNSGFFYEDTWDKLKNWVLQTNSLELSSTPFTEKQRELANQEPVWPKLIGFVEIWMSWDVDDSGKDKEIVVYYHRLSRTIIGIRYNWYDDLRRPYRTAPYFPVQHRWYGIGVGKQIRSFQIEITIQHRQRLDNATIANIRMFKIQKLAGYGPGEPIFPGKLWFVDNMDDIQSLEAGEVYPSSFNDEIQSLNYAQQRGGVNELNQGMPQVGTPGTATSDMARLQEGNKKNDFTTKNFRRFLTQIARDCIYNTFQFGTRNIQVFDYIPEGDKVKQFIQNAPLSLIREQLICNIKLIGQNDNALQDRASWTQLGGQLQQYYNGLMQFAMQIQDKQLIMMLSKIIPSGATEAMKQILQTYPSISNIERIIPEQLILGWQPDHINNPAITGLLPSAANGDPNSQPTTGFTGAQQAPGMGNPNPSS